MGVKISGGVKTFRFGPGSLEMLTLKLWNASQGRRFKYGDETAQMVRVELAGAYDVYCGGGDMHRVSIQVKDSTWVYTDGQSISDDSNLTQAWRFADEHAAYLWVSDQVNYELDGWTDPCDDACEEVA